MNCLNFENLSTCRDIVSLQSWEINLKAAKLADLYQYLQVKTNGVIKVPVIIITFKYTLYHPTMIRQQIDAACAKD